MRDQLRGVSGAAALLLLLAAAVRPAAAQPQTTIVVWHNWQGEVLDARASVFREYERQHPGVKIELVRPDRLAEELFAAVPAGQGPDVVALLHDSTGQLVEAGIVVPLDEYVDPNELSEAFEPVAVRAATYKGRLYGLPASLETITLFYNRDLIAAGSLPRTTAELLTRAAEFNAAHPDRYYLVYPVRDPTYTAPWIFGHGGWYVEEDGNVGLTADGTLAALRFIARLRDLVPPELDYAAALSLFLEQRAAIMLNGPWAIDEVEQAGVSYGLARIPIVRETGRPAAPFVGVETLYVTTNAEQPALAIDLVKFFTRWDNQAYTAIVTKTVPASTGAQQSEALLGDPTIQHFAAQASVGVPLPNTPYAVALWGPLARTLDAIWVEGASPEEAAYAGQATAEEAVARLQRLLPGLRPPFPAPDQLSAARP